MASITVDEFRAAMGSFTAGVTVITTQDGAGKAFGLTLTAFSSVSKNPPLCLICVAHAADAYPALVESGRFAVNFLAADQQGVSARFATSGLDKFDGVAFTPGPITGCALLAGTLGSVECEVTAVHRAGDHDVFIGAIQRVELTEGAPLLYFRSRYGTVQPL
jgi:3-hydroxy-9,10-secoandrosta-1,3,5(10)-triene-9,17-dione monooxygenase reductase component